MEKLYLLPITFLFSLFLLSFLSAQLCPSNYADCQIGTSIICAPTTGYCTNLLINIDKSCSLEKGGTYNLPKTCCSTSGNIIDYRTDGTTYHCCSSSYPYYNSVDNKCYNIPQTDSDNFYTRLSECTTGKCIGEEYFKCSDYGGTKWIFKYQLTGTVIIDKCGVDCITDSNCNVNWICQNNKCVEGVQNFYRFSDNACNLLTIKGSLKTDNDYSTLIDCQNKIVSTPQTNITKQTFYRFENNDCISMLLIVSEKTDNDYTTLSECQSKIALVPKTWNFKDTFTNFIKWIKSLFGVK